MHMARVGRDAQSVTRPHRKPFAEHGHQRLPVQTRHDLGCRSGGFDNDSRNFDAAVIAPQMFGAQAAGDGGDGLRRIARVIATRWRRPPDKRMHCTVSALTRGSLVPAIWSLICKSPTPDWSTRAKGKSVPKQILSVTL